MVVCAGCILDYMILPESFYVRDDVCLIAKELLGKVIVTNFDGKVTTGMIVETEAYEGVTDRACHAFGNRRTKRTEVMYNRGGVAYVYLCYGIHHLFNVVTNTIDTPHAILIRGIEPLEGKGIMLERRGKNKLSSELTAGPGSLSQALGITTEFTGASLLNSQVIIEDRGYTVAKSQIIADTRVGVAYAKEDAYLPYRFYLKGNKFVSKGKGAK